MFILQTTTAVLIAFLALLAWSEVRNRLAKGRSRRKDLESPASPPTSVTSDVKAPISDGGTHILSAPDGDKAFDKELEAHKQLYFKLHNLERFPEILPECRELLLSLFSSTITDALKEPASGILAIAEFSRDALDNFIKAKDADCTNRWEEYLARRKAGGPREMFSDKTEADWWLRQAAPVKYVDGAWLGHINKISTPFVYRQITKNAWQVMSEELGDGDLAKNHVHVYRDLMKDINAKLPAAHCRDFIHPRHELSEGRCWKAAMAQLTISLFPHEFLPEVLGFNMAYESLPLHLLKTVKELRELRLNPYYFELHISIDNADSGHAAMAMAAVVDYMEIVEQTEGADAARVAWKRIQAGYILAEGLPTTPESPSLKEEFEQSLCHSDMEAALLAIFTAKTSVAHKIHCNSRLRIGRRSLVDWLEPNAFRGSQWQKEFLQDLRKCKPWVIEGNSHESRLVKELSWEGRMFGSFTEKEVEIVKQWIDSLGSQSQPLCPNPAAYYNFTQQISKKPLESTLTRSDIFRQYPVFSSALTIPKSLNQDTAATTARKVVMEQVSLTDMLPLWFTSTALLESLPNVPVRAADKFGSAIVRVLRAQTGFDVEGPGVAGMDEVHRTDNGHAIGIVELGLDMCRKAGLEEPTNLTEVIAAGDARMIELCEWMLHMSMHWVTYRDMLIGMSWGFLELHQHVSQLDGDQVILGAKARHVLSNIAHREEKGLGQCKGEIEKDIQRIKEFEKGVLLARRAIAMCFRP